MPHQLLQDRVDESGSLKPTAPPPRSYKRDFDKDVRRKLTLKVGEDVFVDRSQLATFVSNAADEMANLRYSKLLRQSSGPFQIFTLLRRTVTIEEENIPNNVSVDCLILSPTRVQVKDTSHDTMQISQPWHETGQQRTASNEVNKATERDTTAPQA